MLVIGPEGEKLGILRIEEALAKARAHHLDLIEVAPNVQPPVCKIVDYGKYRYQMAKQERESRKHTQAGRVKEVKLRPNIAQHDYMTKLRNAEAFLDKGMKVKISLWFRGREAQHAELGYQVVRRICSDLAHIGNVEVEPKLMGRTITTMVAPLPAAKRQRKYSAADHEPEDEAEDEGHDEAGENAAEPAAGQA